MTKTAWHYMTNGANRPVPPRIIEPPNTQYIRHRSPSKRRRDESRNWQYLERKRIFQEAYKDNVLSIGEIVALTSSISIGINRAEVLVDPKLRYRHPALKFEVPPPITRPMVTTTETKPYPYPRPNRSRPDFNTHTLD